MTKVARVDEEQASGDRLPFRVTQDGWFLTEDCTLSLDGAYIRKTEAREFIFAESVSIIPKGKGEVAYRLRPTDQSLKDATLAKSNVGFGPPIVFSTDKPIIKLYAAQIALKPSMGLTENDGRTILAGGAEGNVLGAAVITNEIKNGTRIMPPQVVEIFMLKGKP